MLRGVSALVGGMSAPGVCVSALGGVSALVGRGVCSGGQVSAPGGCLLLGGCLLQGGCGITACTEADTPPVNRMTDRCKNITLATTSLRPVKIPHCALKFEAGEENRIIYENLYCRDESMVEV